MPLPEYIPTRLVSGGGAFGLESGEPIRVRVRAQASRQLVWSATGQVFGIDPVTKTSEPGESVYFDLPVTDAAGWRDRKTNQLIDVSAPGSHSHTYKIAIALLDKRGSVLRGSEIEFDHVAIPTGATTIDLDTLVPGTTTAGVVVQFPDEWRAITEEARAEATAAAVSAAAAAGSAEASAQSAATAVEAVESKIDEDQIGAAGGVAALGSDAKLLEANVPARLSEAGLSATIAQVSAWAKNPDTLITGAITRNASGVITTAGVVWPDGKTGTFTTDAIDASGAINGYYVTRVDGSTTTTYTQPTITRDSSGAATTVPQIVVS